VKPPHASQLGFDQKSAQSKGRRSEAGIPYTIACHAENSVRSQVVQKGVRLKIEVRNVADQVYSAVRDRILTGQIPPETPVRQDALSAELGVSKIPLREALTRLEQDGLVSSLPNRGYVVRSMTPDEAEEVFALRLRLEPEATALGATRADVNQHRVATTAFDLLEAESQIAGSRVAVLNREFHLALIRPSGRVVTTQVMERLHLLAERYVRAHLEPQGRDRRARAEHAGLLKAWLAGDVAAVRRQVEAHINGTVTDLRLELQTKTASLAPSASGATTNAKSKKHSSKPDSPG
jgi:DNA-binding GntR family transcriptional regulator